MPGLGSCSGKRAASFAFSEAFGLFYRHPSARFYDFSASKQLAHRYDFPTSFTVDCLAAYYRPKRLFPASTFLLLKSWAHFEIYAPLAIPSDSFLFTFSLGNEKREENIFIKFSFYRKNAASSETQSETSSESRDTTHSATKAENNN